MELWYPPAGVRPGPSWKQWQQANSVRGVVLHSMVGPTTAALGELYKQTRKASWHFSVSKDGSVLQHYPLNVSAWHCGSETWNTKLIGIEHEGGPEANPSEPLTAEQLASSVALVKWIAQQGGWKLSRSAPQTLYEHNEVSPVPTACPSKRIPWTRYTMPDKLPPNVAIEVVVNGQRLSMADGEYGHYDAEVNMDIYRRPVDFGALGKGHVVVGVARQ